MHTDFEQDLLFCGFKIKKPQTLYTHTHHGLVALYIQDLVENCHTLQTGPHEFTETIGSAKSAIRNSLKSKKNKSSTQLSIYKIMVCTLDKVLVVMSPDMAK